MTGHAYLESGTLAEGGIYASGQAGTGVLGLSREPLTFRRACYLGGIWTEKIVSYNLRVALVGKIASKYIHSGVELAVLIREGNSGLDYALENFEIEGGSRFSVYATRCIRQHIERAIQGRTGGGLS